MGENKENLEENLNEEVQEGQTEAQEDANAQDMETPEEEIPVEEKLQKELDETKKDKMRLMADMENLRKRSQTEKMEYAKYANQNLLQDILPIMDNFERAIMVETESQELKNFLKGFEMINTQLNDILKNSGLEKIEALDQVFDPNLHEAAMSVADENYDDDIIIEVLRTGYKYKEKVIRPAMVKVVKN